ncbi:hypothetical protein pb186bvf_016082 [Paramecium bursaria]
MGCKPQQKMLNNRQLDDICLIQSCQPAPIIINQIQVKTASFSKKQNLIIHTTHLKIKHRIYQIQQFAFIQTVLKMCHLD